MKIILIGDIHGKSIWKEIVKEPCDKIVFVGDYVDTHEQETLSEQLYNFQEIVNFKKANKDKVILLIGNHDFHYMRFLGVTEKYSGFTKEYSYAFAFEDIFKQNFDLFQMAYLLNEDIIVTHAGVSVEFLKRFSLHKDLTPKAIVQNLNELWNTKPLAFKFYGSSFYGDSPEASSIWIRPNSLIKYGIPCNQIMGHTIQRELFDFNIKMLDIVDGTSNTSYTYWYIDCLETSKEFLIWEDDKFTVKKLPL